MSAMGKCSLLVSVSLRLIRWSVVQRCTLFAVVDARWTTSNQKLLVLELQWIKSTERAKRFLIPPVYCLRGIRAYDELQIVVTEVREVTQTVTTTSCKHSLVLLRMGEIIARNMLSWLKLLIKLLLLHLVGCLYNWITTVRCVIPQKSAVFLYFAAEFCNHAQGNLIEHSEAQRSHTEFIGLMWRLLPLVLSATYFGCLCSSNRHSTERFVNRGYRQWYLYSIYRWTRL